MPDSSEQKIVALNANYLEVVKHPGVLERSLAHLGGLLLVLLDGTLVNATALVDQVTSGGRLTGIDVSNDNEGDMNLGVEAMSGV